MSQNQLDVRVLLKAMNTLYPSAAPHNVCLHGQHLMLPVFLQGKTHRFVMDESDEDKMVEDLISEIIGKLPRYGVPPKPPEPLPTPPPAPEPPAPDIKPRF